MSSNSSDTKVNSPTPSDSSDSSGDLLNKDKYPQTAFQPINRTPQWRHPATLAQSRVMTISDGISSNPTGSRLEDPAQRRTYRHIAPRPAGTIPRTNTAPGTRPNSSQAQVHTGMPLAPPFHQQASIAPHGVQQRNSHHIRPNPNTISPAPWGSRPVNTATTTTSTTTNLRSSTYTARHQLEDYRNETEDELQVIRRQRRRLLREQEALRGREQELTMLAEVLRELPGGAEGGSSGRRKEGRGYD